MGRQYDAQALTDLFSHQFELAQWVDLLYWLFPSVRLEAAPRALQSAEGEPSGYLLGSVEPEYDNSIGFFYFEIEDGSVLKRRVGLRNLLSKWVKGDARHYDAALVVFDSGSHWRLSLVCDYNEGRTAPRRYTYVFGAASQGYKTAVSRFLLLQEGPMSYQRLREAFSVEALSREFYQKLFGWYSWAISEEAGVTFPNLVSTTRDDRDNIHEKLIRMVTRLLFVWFIKQRDLVPGYFFDVKALEGMLVDFDAHALDKGEYYNAILQNLFFGTLNREMGEGEGKGRRFAGNASRREARNMYRYEEMFAVRAEDKGNQPAHRAHIVQLFDSIPFINGGIFENLDKFAKFDLVAEDTLYDGFSRNDARFPNGHYRYRAFVPNALFFGTRGEKGAAGQLGLIELFEQYNFTVEENSGDEEVVSLNPDLLGQVFESLLAEYNEESQVSVRKVTGSFFTPRQIVEGMVEWSLEAYLVGCRLEGLTAERTRGLLQHHDVTGWPEPLRRATADALRRVKILDPACGSGAFPMGCLLRLVDLIQILEPDATDTYGLKKELIYNCIYGVDIQPIAMLICRLRFFISLICDQKDIDRNDREGNYGVDPLPNLEHHFVAADTLREPRILALLDNWTTDRKLIAFVNEMQALRKQHYYAHNRSAKERIREEEHRARKALQAYIEARIAKMDEEKEKYYRQAIAQCEKELERVQEPRWVEQQVDGGADLFKKPAGEPKVERVDANAEPRKALRQRIATMERELADEQRRLNSDETRSAAEELATWNPYDQVRSADFFSTEWMFNFKEKFDIVIGNPPYIQLQARRGELAKRYEEIPWAVFERMGDIYCLFYEKGLQLLRAGGHLCYITSNKWMRAGYGASLRNFLTSQANPLRLIDFAGQKMFASATVDTSVLLLEKGGYSGSTACWSVRGRERVGDDGETSIFHQPCVSHCSFNGNRSWAILNDTEQSIRQKVEAVGVPLGEWDVKINIGMLTSCNEAFIIDGSQREAILASCATAAERKRTEEVIRPLLRGRDIKRYSYEWAGLYLITMHNGIDEKTPPVEISKYPAIKAHLNQYWDKISRRSAQGATPYNLRSCQYIEEFSKPKIIYPNMTKFLPFVYDEAGYFTNQKCFIITGSFVAYLTAFFNSSLFKYCFRNNFPELQGGTRELSKIFFDKIPVLKVSKNIDEQFAELVRDIQSEYTKEKAQRIDSMIFDLYQLTPEERKAIGFIEIE